jgi:dihydropyrimidinase
MLDHSFHQIISDPTPEVLEQEVPRIVADGVRSLKVFLTYEPLHLSDAEYIKVLLTARKHGCLVTVHCENYDAIGWRTQALLAAGLTGPKYHAWSRPRVVEREATHRAIALAELVDQPIQVFHVSCEDAAEEIARAQARGVKVWGETCPQYVTLTAADMDRPGFEGAKFMCSPSPRDTAEHARIWEHDPARQSTLFLRHCGLQLWRRHGKAVAAVTQASRRSPNELRPRGAAADHVQRGRVEGADQPRAVRRADQHQPGPDMGLTRKARHPPAPMPTWLGSRAGDHHQPADAARHRLHAI